MWLRERGETPVGDLTRTKLAFAIVGPDGGARLNVGYVAAGDDTL
jgi:hypothetical protein